MLVSRMQKISNVVKLLIVVMLLLLLLWGNQDQN